MAAEAAEADRLAAEEAEAERLAAEEAEADRLAAEEAEADRLAAELAHRARTQAIAAAAQRWSSMHSSACDGLDESASAKMRTFTERLESWYNERMLKFDEDAAFREAQEGKYGDRDGYSRSVLSVAEGKISGARSKAL